MGRKWKDEGVEEENTPSQPIERMEEQQSYPTRLDLLHVQRQEELGGALQPHPLLGHPQVAHAILGKKQNKQK